MAASFGSLIAACYGNGNSSTSTVSAGSPLNVSAGDLLVAYFNYGGGANASTIYIDDGSGGNTFSKLTYSNGYYIDTTCGFGYVLSATANASMTPVIHQPVNGSSPVTFWVVQFRPTGGSASLDAGPSSGKGSASPYQSGNITTTGTTELVFGGYGCQVETGTEFTAQIGGGAADGNEASAYLYAAIAWRATTGTNIYAYGTGQSAEWVCDACSFSISSGGPSGMWLSLNRP